MPTYAEGVTHQRQEPPLFRPQADMKLRRGGVVRLRAYSTGRITHTLHGRHNNAQDTRRRTHQDKSSSTPMIVESQHSQETSGLVMAS
jgi:hypothetical protein